jgi:parallel beta-helix repeat protein
VTGIAIGGGSPVVSDNSVTGATKFGISIGSQAMPQLSGNTVCGNGLNLMVAKGAAPVLGENDICTDEPAPSAG